MTNRPETPQKRKPRQPSKGGEADPAQYERFLATARELGCEENVDRLDEVVRRAAKLPPGRESVMGTRKGKKP
jgi:hypothetical protein